MRRFILALILILALSFNAQAENIITSKAQLNAEGMKVATGEGGAAMLIIENELPNAELVYISTPQSYEEVKQGKIDACIEDRNMLELAVQNGLKGVKILDENMSETVKIAVGISRESKIKDLKDNVNKFIAEIKADGTLNDMHARWVVNKDYNMPEIKLNNNNNKLIIGTTGIVAPYSFYKGTELAGFDIELAYRFAAWLDADIEFKVYDFAGLVTAAATGKIDLAMSNLNVTKERAEVIDFSDALFEMPVGILVKAVKDDEQAQITRKEQLNNNKIRIGVNETTATLEAVKKELPNANIVYMDMLHGYESVAQGKIDAYAYERVQMELAIKNGLKGVRLLDENFYEMLKVAVGISPEAKIKDLRDKFNKFLAEIRSDGTFQDMRTRWVINKNYNMPEIKLNLENPKEHLRVGTAGMIPPFSFYKGTELVGFDIELAYRFAAWLDADIEFKIYDFGGIVAAAAAGKIDCIMSNLQITDDNKDRIMFSDPLDEKPSGILVKADNNIANTEPELKNFKAEAEAEAENTFWDEIKASFNKTFIREGRYRLFIDGVLITLLITCLACIFGTALGFVIFLICRKHEYKLVTLFFGFIHGTPMVVLLMILYYIIFGKLAVSGVFTAVIAFTLTLSAGVYGLLKIGVGAVDKGQYEAAYALGYSELKTFFKIILPQALPHVINAYRGEIIAMLKGTAIVGYIAVMDLTKVGDVIRARTYEPFFPLIAITLIYFVLEFVIFIIIKYLQNKLDYKNRTPEEILGFGLEVISHD